MLKIMLEIDPVFVHIPTPPNLDEGLHALESVHLKVRDGTRRVPFGRPTFNSDKRRFAIGGYFVTLHA